MFTNGVVASVKICGGGDDGAPWLPASVSAWRPHTASTRGATDETDSGDVRSTDGGVVVSGPAPQEGFET